MTCKDEELSTIVLKFEVLDDKIHAGFHIKIIKNNAIEYNIIKVLVEVGKTRNNTGPVQAWPNYYQLKNIPAQKGNTPYMYMLTLSAPVPQDGQTHSNNSSPICRRIV